MGVGEGGKLGLCEVIWTYSPKRILIHFLAIQFSCDCVFGAWNKIEFTHTLDQKFKTHPPLNFTKLFLPQTWHIKHNASHRQTVMMIILRVDCIYTHIYSTLLWNIVGMGSDTKTKQKDMYVNTNSHLCKYWNITFVEKKGGGVLQSTQTFIHSFTICHKNYSFTKTNISILFLSSYEAAMHLVKKKILLCAEYFIHNITTQAEFYWPCKWVFILNHFSKKRIKFL